MRHVARIALSFAIVVSATLAAYAQATPTPAPAKPAASVAGRWSLPLETPHGKLTANFELKVDGRKVTGTFATDNGNKMGLTGEVADGKVVFKTAEGGLTITAIMKDADTMNAVVSSERGDLVGVAKRVKSEKLKAKSQKAK